MKSFHSILENNTRVSSHVLSDILLIYGCVNIPQNNTVDYYQKQDNRKRDTWYTSTHNYKVNIMIMGKQHSLHSSNSFKIKYFLLETYRLFVVFLMVLHSRINKILFFCIALETRNGFCTTAFCHREKHSALNR